MFLFQRQGPDGQQGQQGVPGPYGTAGGALSGSYPNPDVAAGYLTDNHVAAGAAIAETKLSLNSDAAPAQPSRRSSPYRTPVGFYKGDAWGGAAGTGQITNGNTFFTPIWVAEPESWDSASLEVFTAGSTGAVIRGGIYNDDGFGRPTGTPITDLGTVTATATGVKTYAIGSGVRARQAGLYHLAWKTEGAPTTAPTVRTIASVPPGFGADIAAGVNSGHYVLGTAGTFGDITGQVTPQSGFRPMGKVHVLSRP